MKPATKFRCRRCINMSDYAYGLLRDKANTEKISISDILEDLVISYITKENSSNIEVADTCIGDMLENNDIYEEISTKCIEIDEVIVENVNNTVEIDEINNVSDSHVNNVEFSEEITELPNLVDRLLDESEYDVDFVKWLLDEVLEGKAQTLDMINPMVVRYYLIEGYDETLIADLETSDFDYDDINDLPYEWINDTLKAKCLEYSLYE